MSVDALFDPMNLETFVLVEWTGHINLSVNLAFLKVLVFVQCEVLHWPIFGSNFPMFHVFALRS